MQALIWSGIGSGLGGYALGLSISAFVPNIISGRGWIALVAALDKLRTRGLLSGPVVRDQVAAVSAGHVGGELLLDLCYSEDSKARVDLSVVGTAPGRIVEEQGTAEGEAVERSEIDAMVELSLRGIAELVKLQSGALEQAGIDVAGLLVPRGGA